MRPPDMRRAGREARSPETDLPQDHPITAHDNNEWTITRDIATMVAMLQGTAWFCADQTPRQSDARALVAIERILHAVQAHPDSPHAAEFLSICHEAACAEIERSAAP
jgi:hypothetical protein